jgi:hypothetical protein
VLALVALAVALQICLLMSPESVWSMGTGILRGARRGFLVLPGSGVVGSWDSLGLFIVIFAGALAALAGGSVRAASAMTGMLGLAVANDVGSVAASWCLVALSATLIQERPLRWRWASGTSSVLLAGV